MYSLLSFIENPADSLTKKLHRELILSAACSVNNIHCLKTSKILFDSWISMSEKRYDQLLWQFRNQYICVYIVYSVTVIFL